MIPADPAFVQQVTDAFKSAGSILALSRAPLALGPIVTPAFVLDDLSPTLDERGFGLRLALQWAVEQLAPEPPTFPFGRERPYDDPTWRDPRWWRYNLLRHRYLEPLHPDEFVEGGRFTETLLALTGIPSADLLFDERTRALRDAAQWLHRHGQESIGGERIRNLALAAVWEPLSDQPAALALLGIASLFRAVFPVPWLMALAAEEGVRQPARALETVRTRRCLHAGDGAASLWMSPVLRAYVAARQPPEVQRRRHLAAARLASADGAPLVAVRHLLHAGQHPQAAALLLALGEEAQAEAGAELLPLLQAVDASQLPPSTTRALCLLRADHCRRMGLADAALAACRDALKTAPEAYEQALIYRRMGKLYEEQNQAQALTYYDMAVERLDPTLPPARAELGVLLKDRGWLAILRRDWESAETDLQRAFDLLPPDDQAARADLFDALAGLRRGMGDYPRAIEHARTALALREQDGSPMPIAKSFNMLGILYRMTGDHSNAIDAYREAHALFERLHNPLLAAKALLNIGTAYHFAGQLPNAEAYYRRSLLLADEAGLALTEVRARANLTEALMDQARAEEARLHWRAAHALSRQAGFDDEIAYLRELCLRYPALQEELEDAQGTTGRTAQPVETEAAPSPAARPLDTTAKPETRAPALDAVETRAIEEVLRNGRVATAALMAAAHVSKATATRKLARLEQAGLLVRHGQGPATYYTRAQTVAPLHLAGDLAGLQARLDAVLPRYALPYALERLEAVRVAQAAAPGGDLEVRYDVRAIFRRLPDLLAFFDLERALSVSTRASINLML